MTRKHDTLGKASRWHKFVNQFDAAMARPKPRGTKAQKRQGLATRWADIMARYRRRHRTWVMEVMPTMPDDQWKQYQQWVAQFGAPTLNMTGRHGRKVRRQLRGALAEAKKGTAVTVRGQR